MSALFLAAVQDSIAWYSRDRSAFTDNMQAAVVDNCYVAHFIPDYTGTFLNA